jgi:hypothetical protein
MRQVVLLFLCCAAFATGAWGQSLSRSSIIAITESTGSVSAKVNETGAAFQFKVKDAKLLAGLHERQEVYANFTTMQVSLDAKNEKVCGEITRITADSSNNVADGQVVLKTTIANLHLNPPNTNPSNSNPSSVPPLLIPLVVGGTSECVVPQSGSCGSCSNLKVGISFMVADVTQKNPTVNFTFNVVVAPVSSAGGAQTKIYTVSPGAKWLNAKGFQGISDLNLSLSTNAQPASEGPVILTDQMSITVVGKATWPFPCPGTDEPPTNTPPNYTVQIQAPASSGLSQSFIATSILTKPLLIYIPPSATLQ